MVMTDKPKRLCDLCTPEKSPFMVSAPENSPGELDGLELLLLVSLNHTGFPFKPLFNR